MITVHFLNVGNGDCTIIDFEDTGRIAWIDINNSKGLPSSDVAALTGRSVALVEMLAALGITLPEAKAYEDLLVDPVDYWNAHFRGRSIWRFIATHPDMDHLSGLYRLVYQEKVPILNFWDTEHAKSFSAEDFDNTPYDYRDWLTYLELRNGVLGNRVLRLRRWDEGRFWTEDGITILAPTPELEQIAQERADYNISSYVLWVQHGDFVLVLGGDADREYSWPSIMNAVPEEVLSRVTILHASHHGRKSGYYQPVVKAMSPRYTIVSVGKKPETDASHLYAQYSTVLSTRYHGTMVAKCWRDGDVWLYDAYGNRIDA